MSKQINLRTVASECIKIAEKIGKTKQFKKMMYGKNDGIFINEEFKEMDKTLIKISYDYYPRLYDIIKSIYDKRAKPKLKTIVKKKKVKTKSDYSKYLKSDLWQLYIRPRIINRDNECCRVCGGKDLLQVHHISYDKNVLEGNDDSQLITMCQGCHTEIEFIEYYYNRSENNIKRIGTLAKKDKLNEMLNKASLESNKCNNKT